jgi:hypothetical protein
MVDMVETKTKIKEEKKTAQPNTQATCAYTSLVYNVFLVALLLALPLCLYELRTLRTKLC